MADWETQGFERGRGGTGRTFLSHYRRPELLGKHLTGRPARTLRPAALVLLTGRCCAEELQAHPRPPPETERDKVPGKRQPEPQMLWLEITTCARHRWLHAAGSSLWPLVCAWKRRERRVCGCGDVFGSSMWCSHPDAFSLGWEGGKKRHCFVFPPQTGLCRASPTLLWGTEDSD